MLRENTIRNLIAVIRARALSGQEETLLFGNHSEEYMYDGDMYIHWQSVGKFLAVYIEENGSGNRNCYRLYKCSKDAIYDRKLVLNYALERDDYKCVFSFEEDCDHEDRLCCFENGSWYSEFEKEMSAFNE